MKLIPYEGISLIDEIILRLNGSWISADFIESYFHFHEVLYLLGFWNMPLAHGRRPTRNSQRLITENPERI